MNDTEHNNISKATLSTMTQHNNIAYEALNINDTEQNNTQYLVSLC